MNRRHWIKFILTLIVLYWIESLIPESVFINYFKKNIFLLNSVIIIFYKPMMEEQERTFWYHFFQVILIWVCNVFIYSLFFTDTSNLLLTLDHNIFPRLVSEVLSQRFTIFTQHILFYVVFTNNKIRNYKSTSSNDPFNGDTIKGQANLNQE